MGKKPTKGKEKSCPIQQIKHNDAEDNEGIFRTHLNEALASLEL